MAANPPRKHHFVPAFYLSRWANTDGQLTEFAKLPTGKIVARTRSPTATGFEMDLYTLPGLEPSEAAEIEEQFMSPLDNGAAQALDALEQRKMPDTHEARSAWARFVQSLMLRTPADIVAIKARIDGDWETTVPQIQGAWESLRKPGDPERFEDFVDKRDPAFVEREALRIATRMIDNPQIGQRIVNMAWDVIDLAGSDIALMTSDAAARQWLGLSDPRALIVLPIGPKRLFVAANTASSLTNLACAHQRNLVKQTNLATVALARDFVWASGRSQEGFVRKRLGSVTAPTLGQRLLEAPLG
jgi:hypothetical protein